MNTVTVESVLTQAQQLSPHQRAQLIGVLVQGLWPAKPKPTTQAERKAVFDEVCGKYADVKTSVDEFLARKREEVELEEARYLARHPEEALS